MGAGGLPSGGVVKIHGKVGSLPRFGAKPNSRIDLYNDRGVRVQSRWYDKNGIACRNRDYSHTKYGVHDHLWSSYNQIFINSMGIKYAYIERQKSHIVPDYEGFPSEEK